MNLDSYKLHLLRIGCRENTITRRVWNLRHIYKSCPDFSKKCIDNFFLDLFQSGKKPSYLNSLIDALRTYARFTNLKDFIDYPDFKEGPTNKTTLSNEEVEHFLALPCPKRKVVSRYGKVFYRRSDPKSYDRWTMFFTLLAFTGARPVEIARLTISDVLWGQDCISIKNDKIGQNRLVPIASNVREQLKSFCSNLRGPYLFKANNRTGFFNSVEWGYRFHERLNRLSIKREGLTPYSFRHTFITSMLNEDVNIFKVQKIVGHRRLETTNRYTHMTTKDITEAIKKHPIVRRNSDPEEVLRSIRHIVEDLGIDKDKRLDFNLDFSGTDIHLHVSLKK